MSVPVFLSVGLTNYTNYLLVVARPVDNPSVEQARQSFGPSPTSVNVNFNLDPKTYYFDFRDSPDGVGLGSLRATYVIDARSSEITSEKRFYTCGGANVGDPADNTNTITDPYFDNPSVKITGVFKEAFRDLQPSEEWEFDTDTITVINGTTFSENEKIVVEIDLTNPSGGSIPTSTIQGIKTITADTTLDGTYYNNRIRLTASTSSLAVTMGVLSTIPEGTLFHFNSSSGNAKQSKLITQGADRFYYDGFMLPQMPELWLAKGQHIHLEVSTISGTKYFEVTSASPINEVGTRVKGAVEFPNTIFNEGQLVNGDDLPGLYYWAKNILPAGAKYVNDTVASAGGTHTVNRRGQFCLHSTLNTFRMPDDRDLIDKALSAFTEYGGDTTNRPVDAPGGIQNEMLLSHTHTFTKVQTNGNGSVSGYVLGANIGNSVKATEATGGTQNRVNNTGILSMTKL